MVPAGGFEVRLYRRAGASIGIAFNVLDDGLLITWVSVEGEHLASIWNAMSAQEVQLKTGDKISCCNGITAPESMVKGIASGCGPLRLTIQRGPFEPPAMLTHIAEKPFDDADDEFEIGQKIKERDLEDKREAKRLEAIANKETREKEAKLLAQADKGDLQKMLGERLARSRGR